METKWISISEELPKLNEPVWFRCEYYDDPGYFNEPEVGWFEGNWTEGAAIAMETVKNDKQWWLPCTEWSREYTVNGVTVLLKLIENQRIADETI